MKKVARKTQHTTHTIDNNTFFLIVGGGFVVIVFISMLLRV